MFVLANSSISEGVGMVRGHVAQTATGQKQPAISALSRSS